MSDKSHEQNVFSSVTIKRSILPGSLSFHKLHREKATEEQYGDELEKRSVDGERVRFRRASAKPECHPVPKAE